MRFLFMCLTALVFFGARTLVAQDEPLIADLSVDWEVGDTYQFEVCKIKQQTRYGLTRSDSSTYRAKMTLLETRADGYLLSWEYELDPGQMAEALQALSSEVGKSFSVYDTLTVKYLVDLDGNYLQIDNWEEVGKELGDFMNRLFEAIIGDDMDDPKAQQAVAGVKSLFTSEAGVNQAVGQVLQYLHFPFGSEMEEGFVFTYTDELPSLIGTIIRADAKLVVDSIDASTNRCFFHQEQQLNEDDAKEMLVGMFKQMGVADEEMDEFVASSKFEINDFNEFVYGYDPGIPYFVHTKRKTILEADGEVAQQVEETIITLIP